MGDEASRAATHYATYCLPSFLSFHRVRHHSFLLVLIPNSERIQLITQLGLQLTHSPPPPASPSPHLLKEKFPFWDIWLQALFCKYWPRHDEEGSHYGWCTWFFSSIKRVSKQTGLVTRCGEHVITRTWDVVVSWEVDGDGWCLMVPVTIWPLSNRSRSQQATMSERD